MNKAHLGLFVVLFLLGALGLGVSAIQQVQDMRIKASELPVIPGKKQEAAYKLSPDIVSYSSDKYGYTVSFDKNYWTVLNKNFPGTKDSKTLTFDLNSQFGRARINIQAYDAAEFTRALSASAAPATEEVDKVAAYVTKYKKLPRQASLLTTQKMSRVGKNVYKLTYERDVLNVKIPYYDYVFVNGKHYYEVTTSYVNVGNSKAMAERFIDAFIAENSKIAVKGATDVTKENTPLDDTQITELVNPSVVNIANKYCGRIKVNVPPIFDASVSAAPIQYLKPYYQFCSGGEGSGFIFSKEGHVATNGHVAKLPPNTMLISAAVTGGSDLKQFVKDFIRMQDLKRCIEDAHSEAELYASDLEQYGGDPLFDFSFYGNMDPANCLAPDPDSSGQDLFADSLFWGIFAIADALAEKLIAVEDGKSQYFVKLGNTPLPIDPAVLQEEKGDKGMFDSLKETSDIKEASLVDADYAMKDIDLSIKSLFGFGEEEAPSGPDVAILKIQNTDTFSFPGLRFADLNTIKEGNNLIAIGYPGLVMGSATSSSLLNFKSSARPTITRGIISAIKEDQKGMQLFQTDASLESGNSGGPAVDKHGNVIGMATYVNYSLSGNYNLIRSNDELKALIKKAGVPDGESPSYNAWKDGLTYFWNGYYRKALKQFKIVKEAYAIHPSVDGYIKDAQAGISEGRDKEGIWGAIEEVIPLWVLASISGFFLLLGGGGIGFLVWKARHGGFHGPTPPSQAPPPMPSAPQFNPAALAHR